MTRERLLTCGLLVVGGWHVQHAGADVFLSDNFETQTIPLGPPPVGFEYDLAGTTGNPFSLAASPAFGTQSLKLIREGIDNPTINAITNNGLMVDGAVIEYSWNNYIEHVHRFNAPIQVQLGMANGGVGRLVFLGVNDPGNGSYFYTDQNGNQISTGVQPTLNGWDRVRAVLTLDVFEAGDPDFMTGAFDMFITLNGGTEQQVANDVPLAFGEIPVDDPKTPGTDESTSGLMKIQKGPFSGATYYDNISITATVPSAPAFVWNTDGNGDWSNPVNWSTGSVPNGASATARFGSIITGTRTVSVDSPHTVGTLEFASAQSYTISGPSVLTLDGATSSVINSSEGAHTVSAAVVLSKNTVATIAAGSSLTFSGGVTGSGVSLSKAGAGQLRLGAASVATLAVNAGEVQVVPNGTSSGRLETTSIVVDAGAELDLTNNAAVIDYTATDPSASIRAALASGYAGGAWNGSGINSSSAAANSGHSVGYARSNQVSPGAIFGSPDGTAVLLRYTRTGDANLDGVTNIGDFSILAANFNVGGEWATGDFNYDNATNISDFALLAANFNQVSAGRTPIPEPGVAGCLLAGLMAKRRRRS